MSFLDHLEELRWAIIWILVATVIGAGAAWHYSDEVLTFLGNDLAAILERAVGPGGDYSLHVFEVAEAFTTKLKMALLLGFLLALPFNIYKVWQFVSPGLLSRERRTVSPLIVLSIVLFYCGVAFAYLVMVKLSVAFLFKLKPPEVAATVRLGGYVSFVAKFCLTFGLVFQVPLVMAVLSWMGVLPARVIRGTWRYALVGVLVASAVLTPPDLISQMLMTGPVLILYWLGYFMARAFEKRRKPD
jgi:sec-independent protein translocase protein TatC